MTIRIPVDALTQHARHLLTEIQQVIDTKPDMPAYGGSAQFSLPDTGCIVDLSFTVTPRQETIEVEGPVQEGGQG